MINAIKDFVQRSTRVLTVSYRPSPIEFSTTAKITGVGLVLIGVIGFAITLVFKFINGS